MYVVNRLFGRWKKLDGLYTRMSSCFGLAAAVACEHEGNQPVGPEDVLKKLERVEKRVHYSCAV